jgi:hypothetical protein
LRFFDIFASGRRREWRRAAGFFALVFFFFVDFSEVDDPRDLALR